MAVFHELVDPAEARPVGPVHTRRPGNRGLSTYNLLICNVVFWSDYVLSVAASMPRQQHALDYFILATDIKLPYFILMSYITRLQETNLRRFLEEPDATRNVLLVEGARQVGKTTLIEETLAGQTLPVTALNLERQRRIRSRIDACTEFDDFQLVLRDECGFDPRTPAVVFIDESQESERLGGFVRFMKEQWPQTRSILSGSTLTRLFRPEQRFPVGRVSRLLVTPFALPEFLAAVGKDAVGEQLADPWHISDTGHESLLRTLDGFLLAGGLPAVVLSYADGRNWQTEREEIAAGYDDDLRRLFGEDIMDIVRACLKAVANLAGSPFKNTSAVPSPGTARNRLINHVLSRLEDWKLVLRADQQGVDPLRTYRYHPKRYLFDTGVMRGMREAAAPALDILSTRDPLARTALGAVVENQVAIELSREGQMPCGWKKSSAGAEIDFVVKAGERAVPVECKAAMRIKGTHLEGVLGYLHTYAMPLGVIVSLAPLQKIRRPDGCTILNIPLYCAHLLRSLITETQGE